MGSSNTEDLAMCAFMVSTSAKNLRFEAAKNEIVDSASPIARILRTYAEELDEVVNEFMAVASEPDASDAVVDDIHARATDLVREAGLLHEFSAKKLSKELTIFNEGFSETELSVLSLIFLARETPLPIEGEEISVYDYLVAEYERKHADDNADGGNQSKPDANTQVEEHAQ